MLDGRRAEGTMALKGNLLKIDTLSIKSQIVVKLIN